MPARTYSIVSPKGGSGKTVTAINLARVLAGLAKKVLVIDADASTNGLSLFFLNELTKAKKQTDDAFNANIGSFESDEHNSATPIYLDDEFAIIPATYKLLQTEHVELDAFKKGLEATSFALAESFDYIFIDAQAGTDEFASIAVEASDEIIIVSEYDPMSVQGIERMRILFREEIAGKPTWILFNKMLPEFTSALGEFLSVARYLTPIPWDADVIRAFVRRRSPIDMDQGSLHTMAVMQTALSLFGDEISSQVEQWKSEKERFFKEPVRAKLDIIEHTIETLEEKKIRRKYSQQDFVKISKVVMWIIPLLFSINIVMYFYISPGKISALEFFFSDQFFAVSGVLTATIFGVIALLPMMRARMFRRREIEMEREISILENEIRELQETRQKYKTVLDSDVFSLLGEKK